MIGKRQLYNHLKESLDLGNYEVIHFISLGNMVPVVIMRDRDIKSQKPWCIQHRGSSRYFKSFKEVTDYLVSKNWIEVS
jgi:hypothetical protein